MKKHKKLNYDRSFSMSAICYSGPILFILFGDRSVALNNMPNLVKISCQIKLFSIQGFNSNRSVYMSAICYSSPISAVPTNEQLKFQINTSKTEELVRIYTDRRAWLN